MILGSDDTAFVHGHGTQDAVMGCDLCDRRIGTSAENRTDGMELCYECAHAYNLGFIDGRRAGVRRLLDGMQSSGVRL